MELDTTDFAILKYLQLEGRITMRDLAQRIGMSPPAATERVRRLEEVGIIEGYQAMLHAARLGFRVSGYMVGTPLPDKREEFYRYIQAREEIIACDAILSGGQEVLMRFCCRSAAHLMQLHEDFFGLTVSTLTYLVSDQPIKRQPINAALGRMPENEQERYSVLRGAHDKPIK